MDFVVGHPRSGTTYVSALLDAAQPGVCVHEYLAQLSTLGVALPTRYYEGLDDAAAVRQLLRHYELSPTPEVRVDANWKLAWILPLALERYPEARVVYLTRDPRENVRSAMNLDYYGALRHAPAFAGDRVRNFWLAHMPRIRRDDWDRLSQLERNCAFWCETHRLVGEALARHPQVLRISLESLAANVDASARVLAFLGVPAPDEAALDRLRRDKVNTRDEVKARVAQAGGPSLPAWAEWPDEARDTLSRMCGPTARALGYAL